MNCSYNVMCGIWSRSVMLTASHPLCGLGDEEKRCQCWSLYYNNNLYLFIFFLNKRKGGGLMTPRMVFLFSFLAVALLSCSRIVGKREMAVAPKCTRTGVHVFSKRPMIDRWNERSNNNNNNKPLPCLPFTVKEASVLVRVFLLRFFFLVFSFLPRLLLVSRVCSVRGERYGTADNNGRLYTIGRPYTGNLRCICV